jgi:hypothetical protein
MCASVITYTTPKTMSPEGLRRKLEVEGWRLGARRRCPRCNAPKAHKENTMPVATPTPPPPPLAPAGAAPSDAARAIRRAVLVWLDEAYDVTKHVYRAGVTDESIAKETGSAVEAVKKLREEFYGPLAEPTELAEVRAEIAAIRKETSGARDALDMKLSALNGRMVAAEQKLERAAKAGGWA